MWSPYLNSADLIAISRLIETGNSVYLQRWKLALCNHLLSLEMSLGYSQRPWLECYYHDSRER